MITPAEVRRLALALPAATEQGYLHVMVGEHEIRAAVAADPSAYAQK